ncbi:MAG: hypothetical protein IT285_02885 [Bdellovibrionales bacterium]|nr:hypothetical protein [Bdellovibrionales bacterium]
MLARGFMRFTAACAFLFGAAPAYVAATDCPECEAGDRACFGQDIRAMRCTGGYAIDPIKVIEAPAGRLRGECRRALLDAAARTVAGTPSVSETDRAVMSAWTSFTAEFTPACTSPGPLDGAHLDESLAQALLRTPTAAGSDWRKTFRASFCRSNDSFFAACRATRSASGARGAPLDEHPIRGTHSPATLCRVDGVLLDPSCFLTPGNARAVLDGVAEARARSGCLANVVGPSQAGFMAEYRAGLGMRGASATPPPRTESDHRRREENNERVICCGQCLSAAPGNRAAELASCGVTGPNNMNIITLSAHTLAGDARCAAENELIEGTTPAPPRARVIGGVLSHEMLHSLGVCSAGSHTPHNHDPVYSCTQMCWAQPLPADRYLGGDVPRATLRAALTETRTWDMNDWTTTGRARPDLMANLDEIMAAKDMNQALTGSREGTLTDTSAKVSACHRAMQCMECQAGITLAARTGYAASTSTDVLAEVRAARDGYRATPACTQTWAAYQHTLRTDPGAPALCAP